jgi:hypothetical protein
VDEQIPRQIAKQADQWDDRQAGTGFRYSRDEDKAACHLQAGDDMDARRMQAAFREMVVRPPLQICHGTADAHRPHGRRTDVA